MCDRGKIAEQEKKMNHTLEREREFRPKQREHAIKKLVQENWKLSVSRDRSEERENCKSLLPAANGSRSCQIMYDAQEERTRVATTGSPWHSRTRSWGVGKLPGNSAASRGQRRTFSVNACTARLKRQNGPRMYLSPLHMYGFLRVSTCFLICITCKNMWFTF